MSRWDELYKQKLASAEDAARLIQEGDLIVAPLSNGQPRAFMNAVAKRLQADEVSNLAYVSGVDVHWLDIYNPELSSKIAVETGFLGPATRYGVQQGYFSYSPCRLGETVDMVSKCRSADVMCMVVSPMDKHGFFSTGCNVDWGWESAKVANPRGIIVEVNENMPRTFGSNHLHISEVSAVVENNAPLLELPEIPVTEEDKMIGRYIADMIDDGSCIQLGIGGMPNALGNFLMDKKDLSVHSEMLCDTMVDLYNAGVITSAKKTFMPYKWVGSFALGSKKLYDFIDDNPLVEMHSTRFVNDPVTIAKNDNMISINGTIEADLTGQCASESIGSIQYSGTGGQLDFVQGCWRSKGGKSFLSLYSTYRDKEGNLKSKITPVISPGFFITTSRTEVQYLVTEYGVANLKGQNVRTRVEEMIKIAHPDFRDWLRSEARRLNYIP
ncbi:MAG: acetyl-CoA hydrolase/transferase family protein [Chitinophagales bacterium]